MSQNITFSKRVNKIFEILADANPNPTTELVYNSDFELLVAVVLSAQATDIGVNKATKNLFALANTPHKILKLGEIGLIEYIKTIGLFKAKAKNIIGLCNMIINEYNGRIPNSFDELVKLPGVGRKTANVVMNTLHGDAKIAVDTHVFRVSNRLGIAKGKTPLEVEVKLLRNVPKQYRVNAHHWLILHGRYICKARSPSCTSCALSLYCPSSTAIDV